MWILVKQTFAGKLAGESMMLITGFKYDLPKDKVEQLCKEIGKENVVHVCAPWEEHVDKNAQKAAELKAKATTAINKFEALAKRLGEIETSVQSSIKEHNNLKEELKDAKQKAEKFAKAAGIDWPPKNAGKSKG